MVPKDGIRELGIGFMLGPHGQNLTLGRTATHGHADFQTRGQGWQQKRY